MKMTRMKIMIIMTVMMVTIRGIIKIMTKFIPPTATTGKTRIAWSSPGSTLPAAAMGIWPLTSWSLEERASWGLIPLHMLTQLTATGCREQEVHPSGWGIHTVSRDLTLYLQLVLFFWCPPIDGIKLFLYFLLQFQVAIFLHYRSESRGNDSRVSSRSSQLSAACLGVAYPRP